MKYAQRNKKIFAICIALLFIISSSAALIPNLEVRASETINIKNTPFYDLIPSGDQLFDMQYYDIDNTDLSDEIKYGCNDSIIAAEDRPYYAYLADFVTFLNDKDNNTTQYNGGEAFNDITFVTNDSGLIDYLKHPSNYYSLVTITLNSSNFEMNVYYSDSDFTNNVYCCNGGGATFNFNGTIKRFGINFLHSNDSSRPSLSPNVFTQSNSGSIPSMRAGVYILYCNCPLYFVYQSNNYGSTYSDLNSSSNIRTFLANGGTSPFLIDRREYFTNFTGGSLTVDSDPVSLDTLGAWQLLMQVNGTAPNANFNVRYIPTKYTSDIEGVDITYTFSFNYKRGTEWTYREGTFLPNGVKFLGGVSNLKNYMSGDFDIGYQYSNADWNTYSFSSILGKIKDNSSYYIDSEGVKRVPSAYDITSALLDAGSLTTETVTGTVSGGLDNVLKFLPTFENETKSIEYCYVTLLAEVSDGNGHTRNSTATYDFLTGKVDVQNTASSENDVSNVPEGVNSTDYQQQINNFLYPSGGGNGSGSGGNSNASGGNSTSTGMGGNANATANNEINVKSNWQYFIDSTEESTENSNGLAAIQEGYEEVINFDYQNDSFLRFLFTSGIWSIHPFDYILAFLGTMVTIGIFTGILKLFRG